MSELVAKIQAPPLVEGQVVTGTLFSEPMRVVTVSPIGSDTWSVGLVGLQTERFRPVTLSRADIQNLKIQEPACSYSGDCNLLRLGLQAYSLGIAYEFDPYFGLSISRVDPLPHQLEAVYDYFLRLPRIRFLLADDPGAGKTIVAGLLIKELKVRGLVKRILIVTPANLSFQWQRELKDKFQEKFGQWPPRRPPPFIEPSLEVRSWVKSRQIAWAKSRDKQP